MTATTGFVVTFGEMLLRFSPPAREQLFASPRFDTWWGGAEANVAAGLASLGTASRYATILPANAIGDAALRTLHDAQVDTSHVLRRDGRMGAYFVEPGVGDRPLRVVYDRAHSAFAGQVGDEFNWREMLAKARWLHLTGISAALGDGPLRSLHAALDAAAAAEVPVSLDLNFRPALWALRDPKPIMQALVPRVSLLIANPGAIDVMLGLRTAGAAPESREAIAATARALHDAHGIPLIAITQREVFSASRHAWQAHLWEASSGTMHSGGRYEVDVVDRAGGGDAFVAGLLHMRLDDAPLADAIRFATAAGAYKLGIPGDMSSASVRDIASLLATRA